MIGIAREQSLPEISRFLTQHNYTYPLAADPHREAYKQFAALGIPRSYVVSPDGIILFQSVGYDPKEFDSMIQMIAKELARLGVH